MMLANHVGRESGQSTAGVSSVCAMMSGPQLGRLDSELSTQQVASVIKASAFASQVADAASAGAGDQTVHCSLSVWCGFPHSTEVSGELEFSHNSSDF